ncbi:hypothetical protein PPYR_14384 [Photinus pyralis]|uniref:Uncharacterized protein n=1 Tax=Photinus pyralis TaxID=7054 RepID=A0A5N4A524_PHOPY|nr:interaptin-like [Photinus pyralis]XP_031356345.1 interaptin-like [Photinus pyralis]XP_031356346.1 interaptin-like [Photinus pyralis]KAB0792425.1 hypothetical protein PPYR_14384 [Photinus pyralis]
MARPSSRLSTSRAGRINTAFNPMSSQGIHTPLPMTAGGVNTYNMPKDRRYYMHTIKSHMNMIREEIIKLQRQTAVHRTAGNQTSFRKIAESSAQIYSENQETLTIYNLVLEIQASQDKYVKLSYETNLLKEKNKQSLIDLDNLISAKVLREESIATIKKEIEEEQRHVQEIIDSLPNKDKAQYMDLFAANTVIIPKIRHTEGELKLCQESYKQMKRTLNKSSAKQKYCNLIQGLNKAKQHKESLQLQSKEALTPSEQRENLIQQVRSNKADTESLTNMMKLLEQDYQNKEERLEMLKFQLSESNAKHLKKHKELRQRELLINSFNSTFLEKSKSLKERIQTAKREILLLLNASSKSISDLNFEELDNIQLNLNQSSEADINQRIQLFALRLTRLQDCKIKYEKEITKVKEKSGNLKREIKKFENPERVNEDLNTKCKHQSQKCNELQQTLFTTKAAVAETERIQEEIDPQLFDNNIYKEIQNLEKEIEEVDNEIQNLKGCIGRVQVRESISNKLREIESLASSRNEQLIKNGRSKKPTMSASSP